MTAQPPLALPSAPPTEAGIGRSSRRFAAVVAGLAGTTLIAGLAAGAPSEAAPGLTGSHSATVTRYRAAPGKIAEASWHADSALHPGGRVVTHHAARFSKHGSLYRTTRVGSRSYRIPARSAGRYLIELRYLACDHTHCAVRTADQQRVVSAAGTMTVATPRAARRFGVATVVVHRTQLAAPASTTSSKSGPLKSTSSKSSRPSTTSLLHPENLFGTNSVWNQNISNAPAADNSSAQIANLVRQVNGHYNGNAAFNAYRYNNTWYNATADTPSTTIGFTNCQNRKKTPPGLYGTDGQFVNVPIPNGAVPSAGTDATMTVYRASTDQLWNLWKVSHDSNGWHACWGGRIDHVSTSAGYFDHGYGASASGLVGEAGSISITDVRTGVINHAVSLAIPSTAVRTNFSWPAQRSDGVTEGSNEIPEGTRLRLDPSIDVDSLGLSPIATMIAKAAQTYGFIVANRSGCVSVSAESGLPTQMASGSDPWNQLLGKFKPNQVLSGFPWWDLQTLPKDYGQSS